MRETIFRNIFILLAAGTLLTACGKSSDTSEKATNVAPNNNPWYNNPASNPYNNPTTWQSATGTSQVQSQIQTRYAQNGTQVHTNVTIDTFEYDLGGGDYSWLGGLIQFQTNFNVGTPWRMINSTTESITTFNEGYQALISETFNNPGFNGYVTGKQVRAGTISNGVYEIIHTGYTSSYWSGQEAHEIKIVIDTNQPAKSNPVEKSYMRYSGQYVDGEATIRRIGF